jgi:protease-4
MGKGCREGVALVFGSILILTIFAGTIGAVELVIPDEVFFYHPIASVYGQNSAWINPAALARKQNGGMFLFTQRENRVFRDWGAVGTGKMFAIAYRNVDYGDLPNLQEYLFAFGGGQRLHLGLSYRYIKEGPGYLNKRHLWTAALLVQQNPKFSLGARAENLNRGRIDGERSDIRFVYGAAARFYKDMVTVTFDVDQLQSENLDNADFRTGIEVRPIPGMYLYADFDNHSRFNLGFRLNFGSAYAGHYHNFERDAKSYLGTTYVGTVKGKQPSITKPKKKSLTVRLDGTLPENPKMPIFGKKPLRYFNYIDGIYRAADDDEINHLFLNIGELKCGMGRVEELIDAVDYFGSRNKKVTAYLATPNNLGYLLASSADQVIIPPISQLNLIGLRANLISIKGLMDKVGLEAEIERIDEYKTAPERFMFDRPTEPHREQINRILDKLYTELVGDIAVNRSLTADSVKVLIDQGPLTSADAVAYGLVDTLMYFDDAVKSFAGKNDPWSNRRMSIRAYLERDVYDDRWGEPPHLALVLADGSISSGKSGGRMGEFEMLGVLQKVRKNRDIKGVILRVNSPGGSVLASDLIWHEIEKIAEKKPIVISMGNVAASGGYYISSIGSEIFAGRSTITGSIGVYGGKANISEMLDKIGIYTEAYSRGQNANIYSLYEPFTEKQRQQLREQLRGFYRHFTEKVGEARSISADSVNAIGRGQVWTGGEAVDNGLVDHIGGIYQAMESLCAKSGLNKAEVVIDPYPRGSYLFPNPFDFPQVYDKLAAWLSDNDESLAVSAFLDSEHVFYRMPFNIEIE